MKPNAETLTNADIRKLIEAVAENEDFSIENYGTYDISKILSTFESKDAFEVLVDLNTTAIGDFAEALKLFNEVFDKDYTSVETDLETVVYSPEQIKSADPITYDDNGNVIPLSERFKADNKDIRYSIPENSEQNIREAKRLMRANNLDGENSDFAEILTNVFNKLEKETKAKGFNQVADVVAPAVKWMQDNQGIVLDDYTRGILSTLRNSKEKINEYLNEWKTAILGKNLRWRFIVKYFQF